MLIWSHHIHEALPMPDNRTSRTPAAVEYAAWILMGIALLLVLRLHVLTALLAGLLVFELVHIIAPKLQRRLSGRLPQLVAVGILAALIIGVLTAAIVGMMAFLR